MQLTSTFINFRASHALLKDARFFQILFLATFLSFGLLARDFNISLLQIVFTFLSAIGTQILAWRYFKVAQAHHFNAYLSAIVSSFGICILVRSDVLWMHPLLASIAMLSKFVLRAGQDQKSHFLNPANLAAFCAATSSLPFWHGLMDHVWLSPTQWGSNAIWTLWVMALGGLVTGLVSRRSISITLLSTWAGLLALRLFFIEQWQANPELAFDIWLHQLNNAGLILFAFFMISDPKTTPLHAKGRIIYAMMVAIFAFIWQFIWFKPNGLIVALFIASWTVPIFNCLLKGKTYQWSGV